MTIKSDTAAHAVEIEKLTQSLIRERDTRLQTEANAEHRLRQLQLLEGVAVAANQADTLAGILQYCVEEICRYTGWPLGHCYQVRKTGNQSALVSTGIWHGVRPEFAIFHCQTSDPQFPA